MPVFFGDGSTFSDRSSSRLLFLAEALTPLMIPILQRPSVGCPPPGRLQLGEIPNLYGAAPNRFSASAIPPLADSFCRVTLMRSSATPGYLKRPSGSPSLPHRLSGSVFLFGTDANSLAPRDSQSWKVALKKICGPNLSLWPDQSLCSSSRTEISCGHSAFADDRITLTPYCR